MRHRLATLLAVLCGFATCGGAHCNETCPPSIGAPEQRTVPIEGTGVVRIEAQRGAEVTNLFLQNTGGPESDVLALAGPPGLHVDRRCLESRDRVDELGLPENVERTWLSASPVRVGGTPFNGVVLLVPTCTTKVFLVRASALARIEHEWVNDSIHGQCKDVALAAPIVVRPVP